MKENILKKIRKDLLVAVIRGNDDNDAYKISKKKSYRRWNKDYKI